MCEHTSNIPKLNRRHVLAGAGASGALLLSRKSALSAQSVAAIVQPANDTREAFISRAFEMRDKATELGDQGYGAVIVREGKIIGQSWSRVIIDQDPTAHAELVTIRDAAKRTGNRHLNGAILYSSSHPCPMCEAAAYWAGIAQMIHGREGRDAGAPRLCG
ncbi:MAG: nucleoside deaminase [Hyphomicrobiales bacterium]